MVILRLIAVQSLRKELYRDISDGLGTECVGQFCTREDVRKEWLLMWPEPQGTCLKPSCDAKMEIYDAWKMKRKRTRTKIFWRYGFRAGSTSTRINYKKVEPFFISHKR